MSDDTEGGICCPMDVYLKQWLKHAGNAKDSNDWGDSSATGLRRMEAACKALGADYVALLGCSWMKYLPLSTCNRYILIANLMCLTPFSHRASHLSLLILCLFSPCNALNAVHMGLPMTNAGFCSMMLRMHFARCSGTSKSHGLPFSSST